MVSVSSLDNSVDKPVQGLQIDATCGTQGVYYTEIDPTCGAQGVYYTEIDAVFGNTLIQTQCD